MISSRQEIDLRPQLDRLDRLLLRSAGLDPAALTFEFRPLWQLDAAAKASVALSKAQATAAYAGLNLWPADVTARLVQAQLIEDGIYPNTETIFAQASATEVGASDQQRGVKDYAGQPRDPLGKFAEGKQYGGRPVQLAGGYFREEEKKLEKENEELMGGPPPAVETPEESPLQIDPLESQIPPSAGFPQRTTSASGAGANVVPSPAPVAPSTPQSSSAPSIPSDPAIAKHIIPGIIGPGPFARDPILLSPNSSGRPGAEVTARNNASGYTFGCHRCGVADPGTTLGNFILDHQLPTGLNPLGRP